jgi:glycosyltransferase involved in cell wall biosynthesis
LRILHVIRSVDPKHGGPVSVVLGLSTEAQKSGHTVEVASIDAGSESFVPAFPIPLHCLGPGRGKYGYSPRLPAWISRNARQFDAVVLHGVWDFASFGAWLGLRRLGVPYVIYPHGMLDPWFRKGRLPKHLLKQAYWLLGEGWVFANAAAVLFTCEEERRLARGSFAGPAYNEHVVAYGAPDAPGDATIQMQAFRSRLPKLDERPYLLFLGRIHPKKGGDLLLTAFADVARQFPDVDLVMAGPDDMGLQDAFRNRLADLGLNTRVHWPGMLNGDLKWGALRGALAFVLPSHQENFGIAVAEAMACKTPVIISSKVNIWREIEGGGAGVVDDDTVEGTRRSLEAILGMSELQRREIGTAARRLYEQQFTMDVASDSLIRVLENARTASATAAARSGTAAP